jgi:hypothetical protein
VASCAITGVASIAAAAMPAESIVILIIGLSLSMQGQRVPVARVPDLHSSGRERLWLVFPE